MQIREAEKILNDNFNIREDTFMFFLHERNTFAELQFKQLYECMQVLAALPEEEKTIEQGRMVTFIHTKFLEELLWNYNGVEYLRSVPDNINEFVEALGFCVDGYFAGYTTKLEDILSE